MRFIITLLLSLMILSMSCKKRTLNEKSIKPNSIYWNTISLHINGNDVLIDNYYDSLIYKKWHYKDSISGNFRLFVPTYFETENIKIKNEEADSIFQWTKKLTADLVAPKKLCTDYVGYIKLTITYGSQINQSCEYSSICDWKTLSSETIKLDSIFKEKLKKYN